MLNCYCCIEILETIQLWTKNKTKTKKTRLVWLKYINKIFANHTYLIYIYEQGLALNNLKGLICHKTQPRLLVLK